MALMLAKLYTALREAGRAIPPAPRPCDAGGGRRPAQWPIWRQLTGLGKVPLRPDAPIPRLAD